MLRKHSIFDALSSLTQKVLPLINPAIKVAFLPDDIKDYPSLSYAESGFLSISGYPSRTDVSKFFRSPYSGRKAVIDLKDYDEYDVSV